MLELGLRTGVHTPEDEPLSCLGGRGHGPHQRRARSLKTAERGRAVKAWPPEHFAPQSAVDPPADNANAGSLN